METSQGADLRNWSVCRGIIIEECSCILGFSQRRSTNGGRVDGKVGEVVLHSDGLGNQRGEETLEIFEVHTDRNGVTNLVGETAQHRRGIGRNSNNNRAREEPNLVGPHAGELGALGGVTQRLLTHTGVGRGTESGEYFATHRRVVFP